MQMIDAFHFNHQATIDEYVDPQVVADALFSVEDRNPRLDFDEQSVCDELNHEAVTAN
jgi:hypothetical protein